MAVNKPDIELLFGVLGGGKISGESGALIKSQLDSIVASLNTQKEADKRRIGLTLDVSGTKKSLTESLKHVTNGLSGQKQFNIKISEFDATGAIKKLQTDLEAMLRRLKVSTGFDVQIDSGGATSAVKQVAQSAAQAESAVEGLQAALREINADSKTIDAQYKKVTAGLRANISSSQNPESTREMQKSLNSINTTYDQLIAKVKTLKSQHERATQSEIDDVKSLQAEMRKLLDTSTLQAQTDQDRAALISRINTLQKNAQTALNFTSARSTQQYKNIKAAREELDKMAQSTGAISTTRISELNTIIKDNTNQIRAMGLASRSLGDVFTTNIKKFTSWFGVSQLVMAAVSGLRDMVQAVRDVDAAMTELKKVTDETDVTYQRFLTNAATRAKSLGATIADTVNATADFARLGYNIDDAAMLADAALVYKNVGDGIEDINEASESIISTMQAFGVEAEDAMLIVDKFNEVGKAYCPAA